MSGGMGEYACATEQLRLPADSVGALVVDAHEPTRLGLAALLLRQRWVGSCWVAAGSEEAVHEAAATSPPRHRDPAQLALPQLARGATCLARRRRLPPGGHRLENDSGRGAGGPS
jgi:hypothetical protein